MAAKFKRWIALFYLIAAAMATGTAAAPGVGDVSLCPLSGDEESDPQSGERQSDTGLLEVYTEYGWSAVSSFGFGGVEAQVACVQLGFAFVSNVTILTAVSRKLDVIISEVTCSGNESNISECALEISENPSSTDLSLVYITCDTVRNTTNGYILLYLDSPLYTSMNYPGVNTTAHATYSFIEPSQNTYKKGCLTDLCTAGGHFYTVGTHAFESFFLPDLRDLDCNTATDEVAFSLSHNGFISIDDCTFTVTNEMEIGNEWEFCSVPSTPVTVDNSAHVIQSTPWAIWLLIMALVS